ncbi:nucleoside/nucleotide kinase family protein [Jatrophihabitans sp. DSM 45814]
MKPATDLMSLLDRLDALQRDAGGERLMIGITGAPGAGKTNLARTLVAGLAEREVLAVHVPMDGFHLADVELARLGRAERKGAPDTFDPGGYVALLRRLRAPDGTIWAPAFDRDIEQPIAGSIAISPDASVIITEGNYLLLDDLPWIQIRQLVDEVWFCEVDREVRLARLQSRHEQFGKSAADARRWASGPDEANAELVLGTRHRADLIVSGAFRDTMPE